MTLHALHNQRYSLEPLEPLEPLGPLEPLEPLEPLGPEPHAESITGPNDSSDRDALMMAMPDTGFADLSSGRSWASGYPSPWLAIVGGLRNYIYLNPGAFPCS